MNEAFRYSAHGHIKGLCCDEVPDVVGPRLRVALISTLLPHTYVALDPRGSRGP